MAALHEIVLVLDFGSQYTQLIARRVREANVYCEIVPFDTPLSELRKRNPKGIILSGGNTGIPLLGICYGFQLMSLQLGGRVERAAKREYGLAEVAVKKNSPLLEGLAESLRPAVSS
jgi:GMP synthase (glutamine-hydrolysing)